MCEGVYIPECFVHILPIVEMRVSVQFSILMIILDENSKFIMHSNHNLV